MMKQVRISFHDKFCVSNNLVFKKKKMWIFLRKYFESLITEDVVNNNSSVFV